MTCIVGLVDRGVVYMGGDSAIEASGVFLESPVPKVFKKGEFVIGVSGTRRLNELCAHAILFPEFQAGDQVDQFMLLTFAESIRKLCRDYGLLEVKDGAERMDGCLLVALRGFLYYIGTNFSSTRVKEFFAIGSGQDFALGSLWNSIELDAQTRLGIALATAAHFNPYVREPFVFEDTKPR